MSKHTPGPWEADLFPDTQGYKIRAGGRVLAIVKTGDNSPAMEPQMNRHLIAAVPELLYAAELAESLLRTGNGGILADGPTHHALIAAIAKAKGESA